MANEEQLAILRQGVEVWNSWRRNNPYVTIDLQQAYLRRQNLSGIDFSRANLAAADFTDANLTKANLMKANLIEAKLRTAFGNDVSSVDVGTIWESDVHADLSEANFEEADLTLADLGDAVVMRARFSGANLGWANLHNAYLRGSEFRGAQLHVTVFGNSDLSEVIGLEDVHHVGPSQISTDTFASSRGKIPEAFLRGCGLSDWEIEAVKLYDPDLTNEERNRVLYKIYDLQASQAIQISPLFISYSHVDSRFVGKLGNYFTAKGIRYWQDIHEMKAGRIEKQIDRAIRQNPTVLLVLSEHSLRSDWVEHEVRTARELGRGMGRDMLCPVALDDSWKNSPWPKRIMEQIMEYNILDFSEWEDDRKFDDMFRKLIDGLELFYKG
jgi:uncharacterized protein YjbI with pentapeptide repeats